MNVLDIDERLTLLPVVHGSSAYSVAVCRYLLENRFDSIGVPLPDSNRSAVLECVAALPSITAVVQLREREDDPAIADYVPIEPCQAVIAAIRFAISERIPVHFLDREGPAPSADSTFVPDPYSLNMTSIERYCAASLAALLEPATDDRKRRIAFIARRCIELRETYARSVVLCDLQDWPWIRDAIQRWDVSKSGSQFDDEETLDTPPIEEGSEVEVYALDSRTLLFFLGELPFITGLYERARSTLEDDSTLVVDGIKELLISARQSYVADLGNRARRITPLLLSQCLKFIRNQTLLDHRLSPSFYTIARSAQLIMGDQYTIHLVEAAKNYPYDDPTPWPEMKMGIDRATLPFHGQVQMVSRLPGQPTTWHSLELNRPALKADKHKWKTRWNPYQQCSWPEEDTRIESFRNRIIERAKGMIGADLARTEKFSTSLKDGIDLRETLRHWYDGSLYVKVVPPGVGNLDSTVMLFDNAPDPRTYGWRATWFAEHKEESTLAFYATPFQNEMLGPGVAVSTYGGALFLYPPRTIEDIWSDPRLDFADTLEQRLVAAACLHSESRHIACLSWAGPGLALKKIAKMFRRVLVHVPLSNFSDSTIQQLRTFHVLNGQHVRSYAAHFIRKP